MPENPSDLPAGHEVVAPVADPPQAAPPIPPPTAPPTPPTGSGMPTAARLRDRAFRFRSVVAVAIAGVVVGGFAGAGLTAVASGDGDGRPPFGRSGSGPGQMPGMPGMPGGPGLPGQGGQRLPS